MFAGVFFYSFLTLASLFDFSFGIIPNKIIYSLFVILFCIFISTDIGAVSVNFFSATLIFLILILAKHFTKGIGAGDVKLLFVTTFYSGFFTSVIAIAAACCFGITACLLLRIGKIAFTKISFAPFITLGYLFADLLGVKVL